MPAIGPVTALEALWTLIGLVVLVIELRHLRVVSGDAVLLDAEGGNGAARLVLGERMMLHRTLAVVQGIVTAIGIAACVTPPPARAEVSALGIASGVGFVAMELLLARLSVALDANQRRLVAYQQEFAREATKDERHGLKSTITKLEAGNYLLRIDNDRLIDALIAAGGSLPPEMEGPPEVALEGE